MSGLVLPQAGLSKVAGAGQPLSLPGKAGAAASGADEQQQAGAAAASGDKGKAVANGAQAAAAAAEADRNAVIPGVHGIVPTLQ